MHQLLRVTNLIKRFPIKKMFGTTEDYFTVLKGISFEVAEGEIVGLLGPNGAGKTTTIQILLSVLKPSSGIIEYFGKNFFKHRSAILEKVSFASSYVRLPAQLKVRENLDIYAQLYGIPATERRHRIEKYLKFFGMWNIADKETGFLSAGQMTRVMLAKAFISQPRIILLDEPTASLDPDIAHEVRAFILEQQKEQGISILVTSHNMEEVTQICNRVLVLKKGEIIANDTPNNLALSVSKARVHLIPENEIQRERLIAFVQKKCNGLLDNKQNRDISNSSISCDQQFPYIIYAYKIEQNEVCIELDEKQIAAFLMALATEKITYSQIAIDKPTLEDYFLSIARENL